MTTLQPEGDAVLWYVERNEVIFISFYYFIKDAFSILLFQSLTLLENKENFTASSVRKYNKCLLKVKPQDRISLCSGTAATFSTFSDYKENVPGLP
ncbi:hypothetical protein AVEN_147929-1 [Araneus ventricosus]|uniref:Uncharacterized protein n=1 Tax=Araneus ventricosus TaxID=182803 RepID=A0A4Y2WCI5_ARAVE|nr:hypothetical protein AVEN_147929-1 [Araneus ventricosus]